MTQSRPGIYHVVAMAKNRVIGRDNQLPWHLPADLKSFKALTMGHVLLMGRKTFDSIGRALPGRVSIVVSKNPSAQKAVEGVLFCGSVEEALQKSPGDKKVFIIGGGAIFKLTIDLADGIYLTLIERDYEGDTFYPELPDYFEEESRECIQEAEPRMERIFYRNTRKAVKA